MNSQHDCWWTRRKESELADAATSISGAGVPHEALRYAGSLSASQLTFRASASDPDGEDVELGELASGVTHDDCFFKLEPASPHLKRVLMESVLDLHSTYLGLTVDWSEVLQILSEHWTPGTALRFRSIARRRQLIVRRYPRTASFFARAFAISLTIDCSSGKAVLA